MSSDNSTYEQRIASEDNDQRITGRDVKRISVWRECLTKQANLTDGMKAGIKNQADSKNHHKPIGLFFDRVDWVVNSDPEYREKLANGTTKHGTFVESFHNFLRAWPIEAPFQTGPECVYDPVSKEEVINTVVNALEASELDEPGDVKQGKYSDLEEYVTAVVENFEDDLDFPPAP